MIQRPLITIDSNILVCTAQAGDPRRLAALQLLRMAANGRRVLTIQALGEFFFAATRKGLLARPVAAAEGRFSYWDALLLATAAEAGCAAAISEDMADGAALGSIRVVPAFAGGGVNPAAQALL